MANNVLLEVKELKKHFPVKKNVLGKVTQSLKAVDGISFHVNKGETLGLVGESGCGKTTAGRTIIKLYEPDNGSIIYDGQDITNLSSKEMLPYRSKIQMIFQDPYASLNPRMTVSELIAEGIMEHKTKSEKDEIINDLLNKVGLNSEHANRFPHEFSGGQRQRIGIARALAAEPELIICDEPISALDVSIQAQVINMLEDLQNELGLTILFIAHDLAMVKHISNRIAVMYLGKIVEITDSDEIFENAHHPYTQALISAMPIPSPDEAKKAEKIILEGDVPSPINIPTGCRFRARCKFAMEKCALEEPELREIAPNHFSACFLD